MVSGALTIMRALATVILLLGLSATANAMPVLTGGLIQTISPDRALYSQGASATITVTLHNTTGAPFTGSVTASLSGRGVPVGTPISRFVQNLPVNGNATLSIPVQTPNNGPYRGYLVNVVAKNAATVIDQQTTALDVSPDWWTYPRQCWVTGTWQNWPSHDHTPDVPATPEASIASLNAWHCNNLQFFNMIYRWHQPYTPDMVYTNGDGLVQDQRLIMRNIGAAKRLGMGTLAYFPMYSVNANAVAPNFLKDGSGVKLSWGAFNNYQCGKAGTCGLSDMAGFGASNAAVGTIGLMDATNPDWQAYWQQQAALWVKKYGFDALFIDTYGNLPQLYRANGNGIDYSTMLSNFINAATGRTHISAVLNAASSWLEQDLATNSHELYHFRQAWDHPDDIATYDLLRTWTRNVRAWSGRTPHSIGIDMDMGMDKKRMDLGSCQSRSGATCTIGLPGALYLEASTIANGAHHNWLSDGDKFTTNDSYPIWGMLRTTPEFIQAEFDYQTFGVAYEKLLRDSVGDSLNIEPLLIGAPGSSAAHAGSIWTIQKHRSGFDILHLINFTAMNSRQMGDVQDPDGNYPAAPLLRNVQVKMYRTGTAQTGMLYVASPDFSHGVAQALPYATGTDGGGWYITFTVPELRYFDMIWLENNEGGSNYVAP